MRTLCSELEPLSRPYRHCFVRLLASYRLQLAKLLVNPRYVSEVLRFLCFSVLYAATTRRHTVHLQNLCLMLHIGYELTHVLELLFDAICAVLGWLVS